MQPKSVGLIQVFTGDGKGKTTAALGTAIRAMAKGWKVAFVYFDKGGSHYSEREFLASHISHLASIFPTGLDRIDPQTGKFRFGVTDEDRAEAERGLCIVEELFQDAEHQLIVLDELNSTVSLGMMDIERVMSVLNKKPADIELIVTGRNCPEAILEMADLVSDIHIVKHYFYHGVQAREGLDF
jgi:cob(I)alamin adenosyltransferase